MSPLSDIAAHWAVVDRLLDQALALPPAQRAAWLAGLQGDDARHRAALAALLRTQAGIETDDFLATLPGLPQALQAAPSSSPASAEPQAGSIVGRYRLLHELGRGGMGLVWLAERRDGLATRPVALKLPHAAWGPALAERLAREREILATLEHAHIARLYDAGLDEQGRPYIAMQYVEGQPIDQHCQRLGLGLRPRIVLLRQVMAAVAHAHARLVVHRDLKPGNILVGSDGQAMLLDFGIAKLLQDGEGDAATALTALTAWAGRALTPDYASPEQIRGEPLGTASDAYSLGVVAFELLAGTRPYRLGRGSAAALEAAIVAADVPLASQAATTPALKQALRGDLDAILNRALKKDPAERYPTVDAFAQDLDRWLHGEPVQARPDSAAYRLTRFVGRHRLAVGLGAALAASVLAGSAVSLWQASEARAQERLAASEVRRQRAVQTLYVETLSRLSVLGAEQPQQLARPGGVSSVLMDKLAELAPRTAHQPDERGAQLEAVMLQLNYDNRFEASLAVGQQYLAHLKAHGGTPAQVIKTCGTLGRTLFQLRRWDDSLAMRRAGVAWAPQAQDRDTERLRLDLAVDLGGLLTARGQRAEALAVLTRAEAQATQRFAAEHARYDALLRLGMFHIGFDDALALQLLRQARAEQQANGQADPDMVAQMGWQLGETLLANGLAQEAETVLGDSLALYRQEYGRDSRNAVRAVGRLLAAVARREPARAQALIDAERQALGKRPGGLSALADRQLRARALEAAWLAGDSAAARAVPLGDEATLLAPATMAEHALLLINAGRALLLAASLGPAPGASVPSPAPADDAARALRLLQAVQVHGADRGLATMPGLRDALALAEAQLANAQWAAARQTAQAALALLDAAPAPRSRFTRAALGIAALAAARSGDAAGAAALLARVDRQAMPPFPSAAERADVELRRAQALQATGRGAEAAAIARGLLPALLASQHPASPRLALARQLAA